MDTYSLFAGALRSMGIASEIPEKPARGICCVTGRECETISRKWGIKPTFTRQDIFRAPDSDRIGVDAFLTLGYEPERKACWIATEKEIRLVRENIKATFREIILNEQYPEGWWAIFITTTWKKHGAIVAPACQGKRRPFVALDDEAIDVSRSDLLRGYFSRLCGAKKKGFSTQMLEDVVFNSASMKFGSFSIEEWLEFRDWANGKKCSPLYRLALYLLPSAEELKVERGAEANHEAT